LFDSADFGSRGDDFYFEPDDEVVWNPDKFSPHQRFHRFFGRWPVTFHRGGNKVYLHSATANKRGVPSRDERLLFSDSATSMARTSCSSSDGVDDIRRLQETKVADYDDVFHDDDDAVSLCGSLTYSVESERHHRDDIATPFNSTACSTENDEIYSINNKIEKQKKRNSKKTMNCFPFQSSDGEFTSKNKFKCFQPLGWLGILLQNLFRSAEEKNLMCGIDKEQDDETETDER
jgi:hypothetical protein